MTHKTSTITRLENLPTREAIRPRSGILRCNTRTPSRSHK